MGLQWGCNGAAIGRFRSVNLLQLRVGAHSRHAHAALGRQQLRRVAGGLDGARPALRLAPCAREPLAELHHEAPSAHRRAGIAAAHIVAAAQRAASRALTYLRAQRVLPLGVLLRGGARGGLSLEVRQQHRADQEGDGARAEQRARLGARAGGLGCQGLQRAEAGAGGVA